MGELSRLPSAATTDTMPLAPPPASAPLLGAYVHPFFERLLPDAASAGAYESAESQPPMVLPVEVSTVPDRVASVDEACVALQRLVEACQLLDAQRAQMASSYSLRATLIAHTVLRVLPLPLAPDAPAPNGAPSAGGGGTARRSRLPTVAAKLSIDGKSSYLSAGVEPSI